MPRYTPDEIGVALEDEAVFEALNSAQSGGFAYVHNYQDKKGNVSNQLIRFGINYGNVKDRSVEILDELTHREGEIVVEFHTWVDASRECHSRKAQGRLFQKERRTLDWQDSRVQAQIADLRNSILHPKETGKAEYEKESKGMYSLDGKLYIRDALQLNSVYDEELSEQAKASLETEGVTTRPSATTLDGAIKKEVKSLTPYGYYRTYFFDLGKFAYISIGGITYLSDEAGGIFTTLPEYAKAYAEAPVLA